MNFGICFLLIKMHFCLYAVVVGFAVLVAAVAGIALAFREIPVPVHICCCRVINLIENSIRFLHCLSCDSGFVASDATR